MGTGRRQTKWYEKYLPFVAKSPEMQVEWLEQVVLRGSLTLPEVTPYIRLLLTAEENEARTQLAGLVNGLAPATVGHLLAAADVHDAPRLFALLHAPTVTQAVIAISKQVPPYEKNPGLLLNRVFQAVHGKSPALLAEAAAVVRRSGTAPENFEEAYSRFLEILEDEKLLSTLYPKARMGGEGELF
ncbi:MAG: hypothetical protein AB1413_01120 [Thermodesulfobacteriota bacterium]